MLRLSLILLANLLISGTGYSKVVSDTNYPNLSFHYVKMTETLADHDESLRFGFESNYNFYGLPEIISFIDFGDILPLEYRVGLRYMPDQSKGSQKVDIDKDLLYFHTSVGVTYNYFLRFKAGIKESLLNEFISYEITGTSDSSYDYQLVSAFFLGADYQILDSLLFGFSFEYEYRHKDEQFSYSTVTGINYNL